MIVASNFERRQGAMGRPAYLFDEVACSGHITDDWDRRLCAYLATYMHDGLLDDSPCTPSSTLPPPTLSYKQFVEYIDENLINSSVCYGLRQLEIRFMTTRSRRRSSRPPASWRAAAAARAA